MSVLGKLPSGKMIEATLTSLETLGICVDILNAANPTFLACSPSPAHFDLFLVNQHVTKDNDYKKPNNLKRSQA